MYVSISRANVQKTKDMQVSHKTETPEKNAIWKQTKSKKKNVKLFFSFVTIAKKKQIEKQNEMEKKRVQVLKNKNFEWTSKEKREKKSHSLRAMSMRAHRNVLQHLIQ